ncbi:MAG: hypothetical protein HZB26_12860 [Candidatus Hydrogenedentes bacterium]|nr:hypothetical protein [Candidatus Hydrogenedentota bacterium]
MMTPNMIRVAVALCMGFGFVARDAAAWGPKAQRAIVETALQATQRVYSRAFREGNNNVEGDVLQGALAGAKVLTEQTTIQSEEQAVIAVGNEIQLLREARKFGISRYFAYRMGVLCALMSDLSLPFSLGLTPEDTRLKLAIDADIDKHVDSYNYSPDPEAQVRSYLRNPGEYFNTHHKFYASGKEMIALDYRDGKGFDGYLKQGAKSYFGDAIDATADAWYTVLRLQGDPSDVAPSREAITWYFVKEMDYLLNVKKNQREAEKVYASFQRVNPEIGEAYEKVGDMFYEFGAKERGVAEWNTARNYPGAQRVRVQDKLSDHYYQLGLGLLETGRDIHAPENTLDDARVALEKSLEYARNSSAIADKLNETKRLLSEKDERRKTAVSIIAAAEKVLSQAAQKKTAGDYANAIATYNSAASLYEAIDDEFQAQSKAAKEGVSEVKKQINKIIADVLDKAQDQIDQAAKATKEKHFDEAKQAYDSVESIVSVVPPDESTTNGKERKKRIDDAARGKKAVDEAKRRYEAEQKEAAEKAKTGGAPAPK